MTSTTRSSTDRPLPEPAACTAVGATAAVVAAVLLLGGFVATADAQAPPAESELEREQRALEADDARRQQAEEAEGDGDNPRAWSKLFYLQADLGYSYVDLRAIAFDNLTPEEFAVSGSGVTTGVAAGFRIFLLTLGGRFQYGSYDRFDLVGAMFDLGLRIPNDIAEPYLRFGAGWGWMNEQFDELVPADPRIDGFMAEVGAGFDFWVHELVTVGLAIDVAFYALARDAIEACLGAGGGMCADFEDATDEGDATALQARVALQVGLVL